MFYKKTQHIVFLQWDIVNNGINCRNCNTLLREVKDGGTKKKAEGVSCIKKTNAGKTISRIGISSMAF